jgi:L-alanine-DL-glutamate epimerase-like enolase superfamily enzyme
VRITEIREKTIKLASPMRNASIGFGGMTASALMVVTDMVRHGKPMVGLAVDSVGRYGHGALLRERFIPRLLASDPSDYLDENANMPDPFRVRAILMRDEKPGGHGERPGAVGLIDAAIWDLIAKLDDRPLWHVLAGRFGDVATVGPVPVYASGGHYREYDDLASLRKELRAYRDDGHTRIKIKCGAASFDQDLHRIEAALEILGTGQRLAIDCNGTLSLDPAMKLLRAIEPLGLAWIEEPVDPLDFELHGKLAGASPVPLATGENLFSAIDTLNLLRYAGLRKDRDLLQMDISLSYGIVEYLKILEIVEAHGWSRLQCYPHAGHLLALHAVAGLGLGAHETAPYPNNVLGCLPSGCMVSDGKVGLPQAPGVGFESTPIFNAVFCDLMAA